MQRDLTRERVEHVDGVAVASVLIAVSSVALWLAQVPLAAAFAAILAFGTALISRKNLKANVRLAGWGASLVAFLISGTVLIVLVLRYVVPLLVFAVGEIL